ncbi:hypothetical protein [uncultured Dysosmobacter sp.]|uniref:hypothetical protein n=1 Tax=uncultured Dysosmobacter sp. TaxID=2591384 RepID=UPI00262FBD71|nr:hypothetical protein [uncultured Dysosmobacter sp.]
MIVYKITPTRTSGAFAEGNDEQRNEGALAEGRSERNGACEEFGPEFVCRNRRCAAFDQRLQKKPEEKPREEAEGESG